MKNLIAIFSFITLISSCNSHSSSSSSNESSESFQKVSDDFLTGYLAWRPLLAVNLGLHENHDGETTDYSKASIYNELDRLKSFDSKLKAIDTAKLSEKDFFDYRILQNAIKLEIYNFEDLKIYMRNP